jgi:hypothetical protein
MLMKPLAFLGSLIVFLIPAALAALASTKLAKASRDEWQLLAWVPVIPLLIWGVFIAWGVSRDPTSHNLWPFELIVWAALSLVLFGLFALARRGFGRPRKDWSARHNESSGSRDRRGPA